MKKTAILVFSILFFAIVVRAQDRFDNMQWSFSLGTMSMPEATFCDINGNPVAVSDQSTSLPLAVSLNYERERMVSDLFGWGWQLGVGLRHSGWNATIPAGTPGVANYGMPPTEDYTLSIPMMGWNSRGGVYAALHLTPVVEFFGSVGATYIYYWNVGGKAKSSIFDDVDAGGSVTEPISCSLPGIYGQLGVKATFNRDYFVSLSATYARSLMQDSYEGSFDWEGSFYSTRLNTPFPSDLSVMLGIGIMIED